MSWWSNKTKKAYKTFKKKEGKPLESYIGLYKLRGKELKNIQKRMKEKLPLSGDFNWDGVKIYCAKDDCFSPTREVYNYFFVDPGDNNKIWIMYTDDNQGKSGQYIIDIEKPLLVSEKKVENTTESETNSDDKNKETSDSEENDDSSSDSSKDRDSDSQSGGNEHEDTVIIDEENSTSPQQSDSASATVSNYTNYTIEFKKWTVCTSQHDVDNLQNDSIAAFGTVAPTGEKPENTKLTDMCKGEDIQSFNAETVTIPAKVRSVIVGKLDKSPTTFKFANSENSLPTVKIVDSLKRKKVVVKIPVETLTLPPTVETTLVIDGGSIGNLECDPTKVFIGEGEKRKSLSDLFKGSSDESPVQLDNGITLQRTGNNSNKNQFNFAMIRQHTK